MKTCTLFVRLSISLLSLFTLAGCGSSAPLPNSTPPSQATPPTAEATAAEAPTPLPPLLLRSAALPGLAASSSARVDSNRSPQV